MNPSLSILDYCPLPTATEFIPTTHYDLRWRRKQLIVEYASQNRGMVFPPIRDSQSLADCLQRSPIKLVKLDVKLGEARLRLWAQACQQAGKLAYLRIPVTRQLPRWQNSIGWWVKRSLDVFTAALLLVLLSPLMIGIVVAIVLTSPGPLFFRQWRVGERGRLFQIIKFRSMVVNAEALHHQVMTDQPGLHKRKDDPRITPLGYWLRRYSLDELPQLLNVLRGEMSLVGPRPWALYDAVRIEPALQHRLNALPGITGAWQVEGRSHQLDLDAVNRRDLQYLADWSLWQDFKFLLLTIPKVLSGFGAY
ncbi:heterocyst development glycosyltransferase HepC [Phormidesmis sp. 146-35]